MSPNNFVAVSGISNLEQLKAISSIKKEENLEFPITIGYQLSHGSISSGATNPRQPNFTDFSELTSYTHKLDFMPAFHYYTKDEKTILTDLELLLEQGALEYGPALLQFNTLPPSPETLRSVRDMGFQIILKVPVSDKSSPGKGYAVWTGDGVQDVEGGDVRTLVDQVEKCASYIDYAMFDPSHGTDLTLNLEKDSLAVRFGEELKCRGRLDHLGLVYAGGINPKNVESIIDSLSVYFPGRFSIDIESGVRNSRDELEINLIREYLINCNKLNL